MISIWSWIVLIHFKNNSGHRTSIQNWLKSGAAQNWFNRRKLIPCGFNTIRIDLKWSTMDWNWLVNHKHHKTSHISQIFLNFHSKWLWCNEPRVCGHPVWSWPSRLVHTQMQLVNAMEWKPRFPRIRLVLAGPREEREDEQTDCERMKTRGETQSHCSTCKWHRNTRLSGHASSTESRILFRNRHCPTLACVKRDTFWDEPIWQSRRRNWFGRMFGALVRLSLCYVFRSGDLRWTSKYVIC